MTGLPVSIVPPTPEGRLYLRYHNRAGILTLDTAAPRPCPFGIRIDGSLILDFDGDGVLAGVELMLPMHGWKGRSGTADPGGVPGNVQLRPADRASAGFAWPLTVSKDVQTDTARIAFGSEDHDRSVRLSDRCCALLLDGRLTGFWFSLAR